MTDPSLRPQLAAIEAELKEASARAHRLVDSLSIDQWSRRPQPERWSIGEQILHLNLTTLGYLPLLREAIDRARQAGILGDGPYRRDFMGWLLGVMTEPPVRLRTKTTAPFIPSRIEPPETAMTEFDRLQSDLIDTLRQASGLALDQIKMTSPFDPRVHYDLYSCFRILPAHQRRHLWLGERTQRELAG
jgi:hypothetical protein